MITKLEIENFKCFGDRVEIPLKPITLLFGTNSAGKSSIIQAIHYVREVLLNRNIDVRKTQSAGEWIDLGGFCNFVHNHDLNRIVRVKVEFKASDLFSEEVQSLLNNTDFDFNIDDAESPFNFQQSQSNYSLYVWGEEYASIEIAIAWSPKQNIPYVREYILESSDDKESFKRLARIAYEPGKPEPLLTDINLENGAFTLGIYDAESSEQLHRFNMIEYLFKTIIGDIDYRLNPRPLSLAYQSDALPKGKIWISRNSWSHDESLMTYEQKNAITLIYTLFSLYFGQTLKMLCDDLERLCYIGPLRNCPARDHVYNRQIKKSDWASGLAAWDNLYQYGDKTLYIREDINYPLIDEVSKWMKKIGTGYGVILDETLEISTSDPLYLMLNKEEGIFDYDTDNIKEMLAKLPKNKTVYLIDETTKEKYMPLDVGQGIAQILPVVVAAINGEGGILIVEQPELHIHPKIQANLGDLFINRKNTISSREGAISIIETHSEHLILRILRRIRETNSGVHQDEQLSLTPNDIAVFYVDKCSDGSISKLYEIMVDDKGEFLVPWPDSFFEQDFLERFSL
jgi:predicted ATPase